MKLSKKVLIVALLTLGSLSFAKVKVLYTHNGYTTTDIHTIGELNIKDINFVTVDDIRRSLEGVGPITVSFDIDDTVLSSSPCFQYGFSVGEFGNNPREVLHNQKFWDFVSNGCDLYSIPKDSAKEIIKMHLERGDKVIFITGRTAGTGYTGKELDKLGELLQKTFGIKDMQPINYRTPETKAANKFDKTYYLKKYNVKLHYGDSDDDILAAREAGIRGIRVQRAANSNNLPLPLNGGYGEEVVIGSEH